MTKEGLNTLTGKRQSDDPWMRVWLGLKGNVVRMVITADAMESEEEILASGLMPVLMWVPKGLNLIGLTQAGLYEAIRDGVK